MKHYGVKWRKGQTAADIIDARPRFAAARAKAGKTFVTGFLDPQLEADLRTCMATGQGFGDGELYTEGGVFVGTVLGPFEMIPLLDEDGRPIEL